MYYVYILGSFKDGRSYVGLTSDLKKRLAQHSNKRVDSTKNRLPLELIYFEKYESKKEALAREKYLKSGIGRDFIKNMPQWWNWQTRMP